LFFWYRRCKKVYKRGVVKRIFANWTGWIKAGGAMHNIRRYFFLIGLLIFSMAAAETGPLVVATGGDPKVVLPSQQHVFEPIVEGVQTQHAFTIRNAGEKDLLLLKVKAD
jgi:hypothetical protein